MAPGTLTGKITRLRAVLTLLTTQGLRRPEMWCAAGGTLLISGASLVWLCNVWCRAPFGLRCARFIEISP